MTDLDAIPPHDAAAERVVLCGLMTAWEVVSAEVRRVGLRGDDLYLDLHRRVWGAVAGLAYAGRPVTPWAVWRWLEPEWGEWPRVGAQNAAMSCAAWLVGVTDEDPTGYWAMERAARVRDLAERRRVIHRARAAIRDALGGRPVAELAAV